LRMPSYDPYFFRRHGARRFMCGFSDNDLSLRREFFGLPPVLQSSEICVPLVCPLMVLTGAVVA
jgi:hypothetical protein